MLYDSLYANSDSQVLKLQGLSLPKTLFYDFKVAKIFLNIVSLRWSWSHLTHMLHDNVYPNTDTHELKLQWLSIPKTLFYDFNMAIKRLP